KPGDPPAAWVSEVASELYGWRPGAVIELPLGGRRARFTVAGVWRDYARQQGAVLIERYEYLRHTGDASADDAALWLAPGADLASVTRDIQARVARRPRAVGERSGSRGGPHARLGDQPRAHPRRQSPFVSLGDGAASALAASGGVRGGDARAGNCHGGRERAAGDERGGRTGGEGGL